MTRPALLALLLSAVLLLPAGAPAAEVPVRLNLNYEGGVITKKVKSVRGLRLRQTVPQSRDFSCGAAALATVLRYHYGLQITEMDTIMGMFKHGEQELIKKRGFSLLDMKSFAQNLKYKSGGFKVPRMNILKDLDVPVITLIETNRYRHFVVIRRTDDKFVYISDPSWGNRKIPLDDFEKIWSKRIIFVVKGPTVGTPEGLFAEGRTPSTKVALVLRKNMLLGDRFAMDPTYALVFQTNIPIITLQTLMLPGIGP